MRGRTLAIVGLLAVLLGAFGGMSATARADEAKQLVKQYLQDIGAHDYKSAYRILPITNEYVLDTFPGVEFFGVFFRQYPVAVLPPSGLASSNIFYVQDGQVGYLTHPSDLMDFFYNELAPLQTDRAIRDAGLSWLRLSEEFSQDLFFGFDKPVVTVSDNVVTGMVGVGSGGSGQITATLVFDNDGQLIDIEESRDVVPGRRPE